MNFPSAGAELRQDWAGMLRSLGPGWDSYGGERISEAAIDAVNSFALVPCGDGGIQMEVHRDGFDIEIVINAEGKIESALVCAESRQ